MPNPNHDVATASASLARCLKRQHEATARDPTDEHRSQLALEVTETRRALHELCWKRRRIGERLDDCVARVVREALVYAVTAAYNAAIARSERDTYYAIATYLAAALVAFAEDPLRP